MLRLLHLPGHGNVRVTEPKILNPGEHVKLVGNRSNTNDKVVGIPSVWENIKAIMSAMIADKKGEVTER